MAVTFANLKNKKSLPSKPVKSLVNNITLETHFKGFPITEEQAECVKKAITGKSLKIKAFAGSGKTTVVELISHEMKKLQKRGLYLAFNKSAANEASSSFPPNVECRTVHSMAYREVGYKYRSRLKRCTGSEIARKFKLDADREMYKGRPATLGNFILKTITTYCNSDSTKITKYHTPWADLMKFHKNDIDLVSDTQLDIAKTARVVWDEIIKPSCDVPITHDVYLKLFCLMEPLLPYDFIVVDEAQDSSPVYMKMLNAQSTQLICVGDSYQSIYGWRGAVDSMEKLETTYTTTISQSFRFGPVIGDLATKLINTYINPIEPVCLCGFDKVDTVLTNSIDDIDTVLTRTNMGCLAAVMSYLREGKKVGIMGGSSPLQYLLKGARDLMNGKKTYHPELSLFDSWDDVLMYTSTGGNDLKTLVKSIDKYGVDELISVLDDVSSSNYDILISTAHKSKGSEHNRVMLWSDFPDKRQDRETGDWIMPNNEEINLMYVAITRAKKTLNVTKCGIVSELIEK